MGGLSPRVYLEKRVKEWLEDAGDDRAAAAYREKLRYFEEPAWEQALDIVCYGMALIEQFQERLHTDIGIDLAVDPDIPSRGHVDQTLYLEYDLWHAGWPVRGEVGWTEEDERERRQLKGLTNIILSRTVAELRRAGYGAKWTGESDIGSDISYRWALVINRGDIASQQEHHTVA